MTILPLLVLLSHKHSQCSVSVLVVYYKTACIQNLAFLS